MMKAMKDARKSQELSAISHSHALNEIYCNKYRISLPFPVSLVSFVHKTVFSAMLTPVQRKKLQEENQGEEIRQHTVREEIRVSC